MSRELEGQLYVHCSCSILSTSLGLACLVSLTKINVKQKLTSHSQFSKVFKFESKVSFLTSIDLINSVFQIDCVSDNDKMMKETCSARNPAC